MAPDALPFISNESQDPHLSGRLQYSFAQYNRFYIGSDYDELKEFAEHELRNEMHAEGLPADQADAKVAEVSQKLQQKGVSNCILLRGLGCSAKLGKFRMERDASGKQKSLYVTRMQSEGVIMVNDETLQLGVEVQLGHKDKLTLGRAHIFRVYISDADVEDMHGGTPRGHKTRRLSLSSNEAIQQTIREIIGLDNALDSNKVFLAQSFIQQLKSIAVDHEPKVLSYLYEAKKTKRLVDEANEIT